MTLKIKALENTVGKGENAGNQHFILFPVFSTLSKRKIVILAMFNLLFANAFNLVTSKILSFGTGLTHSHTMTSLGNKPFEKIVGKGEITRNEQFLLFTQCFLPIWITFCHFHQI